MLHRDYLLEIILRFVEAVADPLRRALLKADFDATREVDDAIAGLLDLDPHTALSLSPDSLVTMLLLSGVGDSVAEYVAYALDRVGDAYDDAGERALAEMRWDQAQAVVEAFGCSDAVPAEFAALDEELAEAR